MLMILNHITFRNAKVKDTAGILQLVRSVSGDERGFDYKQFVVAFKDDILVGCARTVQIEKDCKELASLAVSPAFRRNGIGTKLIKRVLEKDDYRPLYLICENNKSGFYNKHQFNTCNSSILPSTLKRDYLEMLKEGENLVAMKLVK